MRILLVKIKKEQKVYKILFTVKKISNNNQNHNHNNNPNNNNHNQNHSNRSKIKKK